MSSEAEASEWVDRELARAELRGLPVVPLLLAGDPFFRLASTQYEDVRDGRMPRDALARGELVRRRVSRRWTRSALPHGDRRCRRRRDPARRLGGTHRRLVSLAAVGTGPALVAGLSRRRDRHGGRQARHPDELAETHDSAASAKLLDAVDTEHTREALGKIHSGESRTPVLRKRTPHNARLRRTTSLVRASDDTRLASATAFFGADRQGYGQPG